MTRPPLSPRQRIVFDMIAAAALKGQTCPTNDAIGDRLQSNSASLPSAIVGEIEELGYIAVERGPKWRVVTIVATGAVTSRPPGAPPAREDRMPSTIGRPDLGAGERRLPYDGVDRLKAIVGRGGAKPTPPVAPVPTPTPPPRARRYATGVAARAS